MYRIAPVVEGAFKMFGYTILADWKLHNLQHVKLIKKILHDHNVDCVIDVGANSGQFASFIRDRIEYKGRIASFEPNTVVYEELVSASQSDLMWDTFNSALGSEEATLRLNIMEKDTFSSFYLPTSEFTTQFAESNRVSRVVEVEVKRLDAVCGTSRFRDADAIFLKVDTQGHDLEVIKGATGIFSKLVAIQIEIPIIKIYDSSPSLGGTVDFLHQLGFDVCGMFPVARDKYGRVIELDGVFLSRERCQ